MLKSIESVANINGKIIDRKLNVAVTRAKQQLIITGNASVLQFSESYKDILNYFKSKGAFFDIRELE